MFAGLTYFMGNVLSLRLFLSFSCYAPPWRKPKGKTKRIIRNGVIVTALRLIRPAWPARVRAVPCLSDCLACACCRAPLASSFTDIMLYARDNINGLRGSHAVIGGTPASTSTCGSLYGTVDGIAVSQSGVPVNQNR